MSEFWRKVTSPENVSGPLTEEQWFKAMEAMRRDHERPHEPPVVIFPPGFLKK